MSEMQPRQASGEIQRETADGSANRPETETAMASAVDSRCGIMALCCFQTVQTASFASQTWYRPTDLLLDRYRLSDDVNTALEYKRS